MSFSGRTVLVTGASSGIGAAIAVKLAALGAQLALVGRHEANLRGTAEHCQQLSQLQPLEIIADVSKEPDIERILNKTIKNYGKLDVLVNNAGISTKQGIHGGLPVFDNIMATNLRGPYYLSYLALPHLVESKGNIVNISSICSTKPYTAYTPYCISKAALDMMTKCLALEFGPKGVRVNAVNPGLVRTNIFNRTGIKDEEKLFSKIIETIPLNISGEGEDIAALVAFLASDQARFITGACHVIDGGTLTGDASSDIRSNI